MFKAIRTSKFTKGVIYYLALMLFIEMTQPMKLYALTSGPKQPEFTSFTPISTSDMVSLTSGDFNYNIPIMDVGGYPINLAYDSGVTMDQEASWVGLGWNLNVGQITRQVRGLPDDFRGDVVNYKNNMKDNVTIGCNFNLSPALFGNDTPFNLGLGAQYNNYNGISFTPSVGISYSLGGIGEVGVSLSGNVEEGATLSPSIGLSTKITGNTTASLGLSAGLNSRKGLENMGMSISTGTVQKNDKAYKEGTDKYDDTKDHTGTHSGGGASMGGSLSFNNQSYTPSKRIGYNNNNKTFNATLGGEIFGVEGQVRITGYGSVQSIADSYKNRDVAAFGYENTQYKNGREGVLDFNREKEQVISKNTNALPVTNYTYDIYNIEGQGVSGMFRPIRSQVSYLYNDDVADFSSSTSFGVEFGGGNLIHGGVNFNDAPTKSKTGIWRNNNFALPVFSESNKDTNKNPLYEPITFKLVGELDVDNEINLYTARIRQERPLRLQLDLDEINPGVLPTYMFKPDVSLAQAATNYTPNSMPVTTKIKRAGRLLRNQTIQKITAKEADDKFVFRNTFAKDYHTAGMKVLQNDGSTYVFGKSVYNTKKIEATFDVSGQSQSIADNDIQNGLISYSSSMSQNYRAFSDRYENRITTPEYAHTFLLTSVLSTDYEDISNDGPSDDDLGSYTKFDYTAKGDANYISDYKWRVPFKRFKASFNEGLKCSGKDQKGNYIYGEKELTYLKRIETKTHVAFIDLENRHDAIEVIDRDGGTGSASMKCIKSIRLYSKTELIANNITLDQAQQATAANPIAVQPIKTAHFNYNYSLCNNIPSSDNGEGKLTLESLYFTYRSSNMGKFMPYVFHYNEVSSESNADYSIKSFDIWGNYKANSTFLPTTDFPFVEQDQNTADQNTAMWVLKSIQLPSGGTIKITTESDDYKYVQNRKAMQMFKVIGAGGAMSDDTPANNSDRLYTLGGGHNRFIYVQTNDPSITAQQFRDNYLSENMYKPIYFKFLLSMHASSYEYVSGYFEIDQQRVQEMQANNGIVSLPLKFLRKDGGFTGSDQVNPIAKSGWGYGRTYLNRFVYGGGDEVSAGFVSIVKNLVHSIGSMAEIFTGPNRALELKHCADKFDKARSWIRLENPIGKKLGGGLRVKKIELSDNWDVMNDESNPIYGEMYGQEYTYKLEDGIGSSGVATFEPNASPENPFVEPFYGNDNQNYAERIGAPRENNYVEKPFGENFFPCPKITYSRVTVTNLAKKNEFDDTKFIKKHATGKVVTEHYTTKDFPTIVDYTDYDVRLYDYKSPLLQMLSVYAQSHLTASQGFTIETNDMDGKVKSQKVYAENQNSPISRVDYNYNVDSSGKLNSIFTTIDEHGKINEKSLLGINYDVINDFNESRTVTQAYGFDANIASFLAGIYPVFVPIVLPREAYNESQLRTATTTKVIHKTAVLVETIAYDLGARVATKNLAWDAKTGQVLLTQTTNEFDEKYYSFNFPSYWYYKNMGMASENIGLSGELAETNTSGDSYFYLNGYSPLVPANDINKFFKIGDELFFDDNGSYTKLWVYAINSNHIRLMNKSGEIIDSSNQPSDMHFKIIRSGNRNQQMVSMASITLMKNPILNSSGNLRSQLGDDSFGYDSSSDVKSVRVINANAIEYSDDWKSQCENNLPNEYGFLNAIPETPVNPYLYNIKGDWRAIKSYAYLTGRNNFETTNRRKAGFFNKFSPFYKLKSPDWYIDMTGWTFASQITMVSPYGVELENMDALKRYSSAQYGYRYTLPMAVVSNAKYREIGFDGFEDYDPMNILLNQPASLKPHFGFSQGVYDKGNAIITDKKSHTGNNSVAVYPGHSVQFVRRVDGCPVGSDEGNSKKSLQKTKSINSSTKKKQ
jgi:hypothetical protein